MNNNPEKSPIQQAFEEYLRTKSKTTKELLEEIPKKPLESLADEKAFILAWFQELNATRRIELAYSYGLVRLLDNGRFEVRNSWSRSYEENRLQILEAVYWRNESHCELCGLDIRLGDGQVDHFIPRSAWPEKWLWLADDSSNLIATHRKCNQEKSNYPAYKSGITNVSHITFTCKSPIRKEYECCVSRRADEENPVCQDCEEYVHILCRLHEETVLPVCEVEALQKWFGHN